MIKTETQTLEDRLKEIFETIVKDVDFGSVKVQIRDGKPTLLTIEKTIKLD